MNIPFLQTATFTGLVSTDEYYTSREWSTAYDIATFYSQNSAILIEQTTYSELTSLKASNQLNPGQLYIITDFELKWKGQGLQDPDPIKSSGVIEPLIVRALSGNKLDIEAFSVLHPQDIVYYDIDAINSYTWTDGGPGFPSNTPIPGFKGWITRRVDRIANVDMAWDWRYIKVNCCKFNIFTLPLYSTATTYSKFNVVRSNQGKIFYSIENNNINQSLNNTFWWLPVFGTSISDADEFFPTLERGETIGAPLFSLTPILSTRTQLPTVSPGVSLRNVTIKGGFNNRMTSTLLNVSIGVDCINNYFATGFNIGLTVNNVFKNNIIYGFNSNNNVGSSFENNIINGYIASVYPEGIKLCTINTGSSNIICHGFFNNTIDGMSNNVFAAFADNNRIDSNFNNNRIGRLFRFNHIGHSFENNITNTNCSYNDIEDTFENNILEQNFNFNTIDDGCQFNTFGQNFQYNVISNNCLYNTFGINAEYNSIGNTFANNTIGNFFNNNTIQNSFETNIVGANFNSNTIRNSLFSVNFTGATHVYNNYDTTLFRNFDSVYRLSYYNSTDQLVITDPTA